MDNKETNVLKKGGVRRELCELWWLGGIVVRTLDLRPSRRWFESQSWHCLVISEIRWPYFAGKLYWDITTTQVNSALHPCRVLKSSTSFGWGKGGKVTSARWQVTLCDPIWHVISCSGVVISITNCYILTFKFTFVHCCQGKEWRYCQTSSVRLLSVSVCVCYFTRRPQCKELADCRLSGCFHCIIVQFNPNSNSNPEYPSEL